MLFSQRLNITQFMKMKVLTEQDIEEYEPEKIINLTGIYYVKPVFFLIF